jgi:hypothetical protein
VLEVRDAEDYIDQMIGMKAKIVRIKFVGQQDIGDVMLERYPPADHAHLVVIEPDYKHAKVLSLPKEPVSLLLARLYAENRLYGSLTPEFLDRMGRLVEEVFASLRIEAAA